MTTTKNENRSKELKKWKKGPSSQAPDPLRKEVELLNSTEWAEYQTDDQFYPKITHKWLRPAVWRWEDVRAKLVEIANDKLLRADRRFLSLVHGDSGEWNATSPSHLMAYQVMNPGEHILPHRHNATAIYHIVEGKGFTIVNEHKIEWSAGDTVICPPWYYHEHYNSGDDLAIQYVLQDLTYLAMMRALIFEEPVGQENVQQVTEGFHPQTIELKKKS